NVGLNLLSPYIGGSVLFDQVLIKGGRHYGQVGLIVLVIVISKAVAQIAGIFQGRVNSTLSAEVIFDLKTQVFDAMQHLSLSFYSKKETGNLMTRINGDAENLQSFFHDGFPYFIVNGTMIIGISIIMVTMNPKLALLVLIPAPVVVYYLKKMFPVLWRMYHKRYISNSKLNSHINDSLKGFRVVKAFGKESAEVNKFNKINQGVFSVDLGLGNLTNALFPFMWFIMGIGSLLVWGVGGYQVVKGELTFGTLVSFIGYIGMIYGPLQFMTQIVDWWSNCMNSAQRIFEIIDSVPDVANSPYAKRMPNIK
ncbi:MAG TPA: ABC transporter, partial [Clostridiaceae bacterium]|nr:ABC transporter [Clostridiaceae bacterium]